MISENLHFIYNLVLICRDADRQGINDSNSWGNHSFQVRQRIFVPSLCKKSNLFCISPKPCPLWIGRFLSRDILITKNPNVEKSIISLFFVIVFFFIIILFRLSSCVIYSFEFSAQWSYHDFEFHPNNLEQLEKKLLTLFTFFKVLTHLIFLSTFVLFTDSSSTQPFQKKVHFNSVLLFSYQLIPLIHSWWAPVSIGHRFKRTLNQSAGAGDYTDCTSAKG